MKIKTDNRELMIVNEEIIAYDLVTHIQVQEFGEKQYEYRTIDISTKERTFRVDERIIVEFENTLDNLRNLPQFKNDK